MVVVPAGEAVLGTPADEPGRQPNEAPLHNVAIAKPFAIGRYAVTFQEWDACVAEGGCKHPLGDFGMGKGRRPALFVSIDDAKAFLAYLSKKTGQTYRLPSEAEWEYAARACLQPKCQSQPFWFGDIAPDAAVYDSRYAYEGSPRGTQPPKSQPVDFGKPNAFGLYNALGNVSQWMADCYNPKPSGAQSNGAAVLSGDCSEHAIRGGSWADKPDALRAGARQHDLVDEQSERVGFRVVRSLFP
jgi:formylglycine-generating enzyme required for sulfatase activity